MHTTKLVYLSVFEPEEIKNPLTRRREFVFMVLAGIFLGSLAMLNILGTSRFIDLSFSLGSMEIPFAFAVGVLPYPITFFCTDLISELYGKKRANMVVWIGLLLNLWVIVVVWTGGVLDAPKLQNGLPPVENGVVPYDYAFYQIRLLTLGATLASMIAYLTAQFVDVHIFHWLKEKTQGKKLWLRNNVSTLTSQLVDSVAVILITHYLATGLPPVEGFTMEMSLMIYIFSSYVFKAVSALLDTLPIYIAVHYLSRYLEIKK